MPVLQPLEESVELYNKLLHLPWADREAIGQIEWRLRKIVSARPGDLRAKVALLQSHMQLGKASEARELAWAIWGSRGSLDAEAKDTFAKIIGQIGMYRESVELLKNLQPPAIIASNLEVFKLAATCSFALGDVDGLREIAAQNQPMKGFLRAMDSFGLTGHFAAHQKIVRRFVSEMQVSFFYSIGMEEGIECSQWFYVDATRAERRKITNDIDDQLDAYYASVGLSSGAFVPLLVTMVMNVTARPKSTDRRL